MAFSKELLDHAILLSDVDRPNERRQVNLRRAVSAAYYSLFHLLATEASENWSHGSQRDRFARLFDHGRMKACCSGLEGRVKMRLGPSPSQKDLDALASLKSIADAFVRLQQDRHTADYDNSKIWARTEVYEVVWLDQEATATWMAIRDTEMAQDYLLDMLGAK